MEVRNKLLSIVEKVSGDKVKRGFTFHKGLLNLLGYDWWNEYYQKMPFWYIPVHIVYFSYQIFNQMGLFIFGMYYVYRMEVSQN